MPHNMTIMEPLNKWTKKNWNISPLIPSVIDRLAGCTLFTKFDIRWGYNNIRIKPGDEWKAAFLTPEGLFEPMVMFFGLTNSLATFQMMMNTIFCHEVQEGWFSIFMDDCCYVHIFPSLFFSLLSPHHYSKRAVLIHCCTIYNTKVSFVLQMDAIVLLI
jgi:hypothetical protein